jgi:dinuclear metal center YbgI/SA1388 family protein
MRLAELTSYLDEYLRIDTVPDSPEALNGLQVGNAGDVTRIAAAVDVCEATVRMATAAKADLLLVHHGLFWGGLRPVTGPTYRRLSGLIGAGIALYSSHIPLDVHPDVGNNPVLAQRLGIAARGTFGDYQGSAIGVWGDLAIGRDALVRKVESVLGATPRVLPFGPPQTSRVGIITGSGGGEIRAAAAAGLDTYITGEGQHWTYFDAEELGVNVLFAGHYATETLGVKALAEHIQAKFTIPWVFLDHPTGL